MGIAENADFSKTFGQSEGGWNASGVEKNRTVSCCPLANRYNGVRAESKGARGSGLTGSNRQEISGQWGVLPFDSPMADRYIRFFSQPPENLGWESRVGKRTNAGRVCDREVEQMRPPSIRRRRLTSRKGFGRTSSLTIWLW